ncbi:nucleotidyltransferase domain-containing protein [Paenibacillus medicaginis]|uniref:Nucleotidyltransferase domain-containing protein n=1 Tax=Paenibacillus medicaginis TaxID=1470560 RepID=A0ABV5C3K3_9BACL
MNKKKLGEIKTLTESDKLVIQKMVDTLSKKTVVDQVILFGSKARGDHTEGSDTDILFVLDHPDSRQTFSLVSEAQFEALVQVDAPVMSIAFTKSKWNSDDVPGSLKANILKDGVEIYPGMDLPVNTRGNR